MNYNSSNVDNTCIVIETDRFRFIPKNVIEAVRRLNVGIGFDGIHSNHPKILDAHSVEFIVNLFNACLAHQFVPTEMLKGVIRSIVKNKLGDLKSSDNYKEVIVSSNMFKIFEYGSLPDFQRFTSISSSEFAYR